MRLLLFILAFSVCVPALVYADEEIVVRDRRADAGVPSSAVIATIELAALRARYIDGARILDWLPGVDVRDFGGLGQPSYVQLRGASPQQVLVLVDGVRLNPILGGGADLSLADLGDMDRIEVLKGPAAARYGSDGIGGVVRFIRTVPRASSTRIAVTGGSFDTLRASLDNATSLGEHTTFRSGVDTTTSSGAFRYYDAQRDRFDTRRNNDTTQTRLRLGLDTGELSVRLRLAQSRSGSPGFVEFPTLDARRQSWWGSASATWQAARWSVSVHERLERNAYENPSAFLGGGAFASQSTARGTGAEFSGTWWPRDQWSVSALADSRFERLTGGDYGRPQRWAGGAQVSSEVTIGWVSIGPSVRVDAAQRAPLTPLPSLGARVDAPWGGLVSANAGRVWRVPSFVELYHPDMEFVAGNPDLDAENGWSFDASVGWQSARVRCTATYFGQVVQQGILWAPVTAFRYEPINTGPARTAGFELSSELRFDAFDVALMYTRLASLRVETGDPLPAKPGHRVAARGRYSWRTLSAFAETTYTGDSFADFHGNLVVPGGTDVSLGVSARELLGTTVTLETRNLLDTPLRDSRYFPLPGRSLYLTLLWEL